MQGLITMDLVVVGVDDWRKLLPPEIDLSHENLGKPETETALQIIAKANGVSFEKTLVDHLIWMGKCELVELEVQFCNHPEWGKMVWIPVHPAYQEPLENDWRKDLKMNFHRAIFKTEQMGEQQFGLYSTAMNGMLHKSLVFHRVVLSPPKPEPAT